MYDFAFSNRRPGTKRTGISFTTEELRLVFSKGSIRPGLDPNEYRLDPCGALMKFSEHGKRAPGNLGWEVDHVLAVARGGSDSILNLQPLQWQNNVSKGDGPNSNFCKISQV